MKELFDKVFEMYNDNSDLLVFMLKESGDAEISHMIDAYGIEDDSNFFNLPILTSNKSCNLTNRFSATLAKFHKKIDTTKYGIEKVEIKDGYWGEEELGYDALYYFANGEVLPLEYKNCYGNTDKIVGNRFDKVPYYFNTKYQVENDKITNLVIAMFNLDEINHDKTQSGDRNNVRIDKNDIDKIYLIAGEIGVNKNYVVWK